MNYWEHFNAPTMPVEILRKLSELNFTDCSWGNDEYPSFCYEHNGHFITAMFISYDNTTQLKQVTIFNDKTSKYKDFTVYDPIKSRTEFNKGDYVTIYNLELNQGWTMEGKENVEEIKKDPQEHK